MAVLSRQIEVYESMRSVLELDYSGKWVVICNDELAGTYESFEDAAVDAAHRFGRGPYLIRQVNAPQVTLPASVLYGSIHAND